VKLTKEEPRVEAAAINEDEGPVVVKLTIPRDIYDQYADLAEKQDLTPADLMVHRLTRCRNHASIRSLYFSTSQLQQLETVMQKRPIETAEQAITLIQSAFSFRVGELPPIPITPTQAKRLHLSAYGGQTPYDRICYVVQGAVAKATGA
jgi:hypothetical protein